MNTTMWLVGALAIPVVAAACAGPASDRCNDGTFCPPSTTCGAQDVCFADIGTCSQFSDAMPCLVDDVTSGYCDGATCRVGATILGFATSVPSGIGLPGVEAVVRGHPEVLRAVGNPNGYFEFKVPRGVEAVIEISYPDAYLTIARPVAVGDDDVALDFLYGGIPIVPIALGEALADQIGIELLPERGLLTGVSVDLDGKAVGGVAFSPTTGSCDGPYYFDMQGSPTTETSTVPGNGTFAFVNCEPGTVTLRATATTGACHTFDRASTDPVPMSIEPGRLTYLGRMTCM
jgi:hypothetical protein